jgi:hypothetical protein
MDTSSAIRRLKRNGFQVSNVSRQKFIVKRFNWEISESYTARELINLARTYSHYNKFTSTVNSLVKETDNSRNRSATRDAIKTDDWDSIPVGLGKVKSGDRWSWD